MKCQVFCEGELKFVSNTSVSVLPQSEQFVEIKYPDFIDDGEYVYRVSMHLAEDTMWEAKGYEIAFGEYVLSSEKSVNKEQKASKEQLRVVKGDGNIGFYYNDISAMFSITEGGIISLKKGEKEFVDRAAKPVYWRASTDNDRGSDIAFKASQWGMASKYQRLTDFKFNFFENSYQLRNNFV